MHRVLVVGCGLRPKPGAINLDRVKLPGVDVVFDLDRIGFVQPVEIHDPPVYEHWQTHVRGLPWNAEHFDRVEAEDVLEHVSDPVAVVQELGRVLKVGGELWIRGPDATMAWHDLTHRRAFSERTFDGFCPDTYDGRHYGHYHGSIKFRMLEKKLVNHGWEYTLRKL